MRKKHLLTLILAILGITFLQAQEMKFEDQYKERYIPPGKGQVFDRDLLPVYDFHFVQFGVYPREKVNPYTLRAPSQAGHCWVILHNETVIKGVGSPGAYYIVKPFLSEVRARQYVDILKRMGVECWYNPELTGVSFSLISMTGEIFQ